jgi:hypothetical protein
LKQNRNRSFEGDQKGGPFDAEYETFAPMLLAPNPNGSPNSDVIRPRANADRSVKVRRAFDWIIDFGTDTPMEVAAMYEVPYQSLVDWIATERHKNPRAVSRITWWLHKCSRPELRAAISGLDRYLITPRVGKFRIFRWLDGIVLPDSRLFVFATDDDYDFGVLQSRPHELWALRMGARHGDGSGGGRPTYNNKVCFETFASPESTNAQREVIAAAANELDALRNNWLNPPEWTREEILEFPGSTEGPWARYVHDPNEQGIGTVRYPRLVPRNEECARKLKKRTLTNLYNERPTWVDLAHKRLDEAVSAAYGWTPDLTDEQILEKLLELNLQRAAHS